MIIYRRCNKKTLPPTTPIIAGAERVYSMRVLGVTRNRWSRLTGCTHKSFLSLCISVLYYVNPAARVMVFILLVRHPTRDSVYLFQLGNFYGFLEQFGFSFQESGANVYA